MLLLFLLLFSGNVLSLSLQRLHPSGRIIGGTETTIQDNPWQVSLSTSGNHLCGGSIISNNTILTAAHCIHGGISKYFEIISGTADLQKNSTHTKIKEAIVHENFTFASNSNDIALIILADFLTFDETTKPINLTNEEPADNEPVRVTGWGIQHVNDTQTSKILNAVDIQTIERKRCAKDYKKGEKGTIDNTMICAGVPEGGKDACSGDSGGPLTKNGILVGVVSWGNECGLAEYPGVYANVAFFRKWIREKSGI